jgi:predicted  nucleic acid-binding Zn-ribbon protein
MKNPMLLSKQYSNNYTGSSYRVCALKVIVMTDKRINSEWLQKLQTERDEINVRMHLAAADVRDEWHELEKKWKHLQSKVQQISDAVGESKGEVSVALQLLSSELQGSYKRIRRRLN